MKKFRVRTIFGWLGDKLPDNRRGVWTEHPLAQHVLCTNRSCAHCPHRCLTHAPREHAWRKRTAQSCMHWCLKKSSRHPRAMSRMLPHLPQNTSTRSLSPTSTIFRPSSPSLSGPTSAPSGLDQDTLRDPRRSRGYTKSASPTGNEKNLIQSDEYELQGIELDRNIGTDPYQIPERILGDVYQNLLTEYTEET